MGLWEKQMLEEYGWYMHAILAEDIDDIHANYHTHGLKENFHHKDFQITLNMDPEVAHDVFYSIVEEIKGGKVFKEDIEYNDIIEGYSIILKTYIEMDRQVFRILIPDERGILPTIESCSEDYKVQLDNIEN